MGERCTNERKVVYLLSTCATEEGRFDSPFYLFYFNTKFFTSLFGKSKPHNNDQL